jgi:nucleotide-binding universal stress UspA family protein
MSPVQRILCGTDLSPASEPAWAEAQLLARLLGAEIVLLHVVSPLVIPPGVGPEVYVPPHLYQQLVDDADRDARERLARLCDRRAPSSAKVTTRVEHGMAADRILHVAAEDGADMCVLGTHGRTGLGRVLLGSVADRVVRLARCPVVTVRARPGVPVAMPDRLTRICYATDFSASAHAAWPWVLTLAEAARAEVDLVHVMPEVVAGREVPAALIGQTAEGFRAHGEAQARRLIDAGPLPAARAHPLILAGPPAAAIVRSAETRSADLIVMGTRGWSGLRRWMLGSVALHVIQAAPCAVLTVGPGAPEGEEPLLGP